jgi:hypothetical protein
MNKPSSGVLVFIALAGALSGAISLAAAHHNQVIALVPFLASFCVGIGIVLSLYAYAPRRWHSLAGFPGHPVTFARAPNQTIVGRVSALGAGLGPLMVAGFAFAFGWSVDVIMGCLAAAMSGFAFSLVVLWCALLFVARVICKQ